MVSIERVGHYKLIETKRHIKILYLDDQAYAWLELGDIGGILVASGRKHQPAFVLSAGDYRIYNIKNVAQLADLPHLELEVDDNEWQSYLLPSKLPEPGKRHLRVRIIPTRETVTDIIHRTLTAPAAPRLLLATQ
ncbi:hypothetical protein JNJ66_03720 [Candidatus Saccharibacteria bacterium]|nr:hypothetical protein [Candidatus Saccharibacteria bacterium]